MTLDIGVITAIMIALLTACVVIVYTLSENIRLRRWTDALEKHLYEEEEMTAEEDEELNG